MDDRGGLWDVFLCYKWEDAEAAGALRRSLNDAGLRVFQDVIEGEIWEPLSPSIIRALHRSRTLVALITPNFPVSPHCREELHMALSAAYYLDNGHTSRVMAVVRDMSPDAVRPRQLTRYRLPRSNIPSEHLVSEIAAAVGRARGRFGDAPAVEDPKWYPDEIVGDRFFRGRYYELWELHEGLAARTKNRDRGHPVAVVGGPGGVGKTSVGLQYARLFQRDHPGGVFVLRLGGADTAQTGTAAVEAEYREQLSLLARRLGVSGPDEVTAALEQVDEPYLWLVDDVPADVHDDLIPRLLAPTGRGRTLITTRGRYARFASFALDLGPLDEHIGAQVLTSFRPSEPDEKRTVKAIVELLGGHPLGLTIAAGLTTTGFTGYRSLLAELARPEPDRLEAVAAGLHDQLPAGCVRPFTNVLLRGFDSAESTAKQVLAAASVLAPTVIPYDLLAAVLRRTSDFCAEQLPEAVDRAVDRGLLDHTGTRGCIMHALVARALRIRIEPAVVRIRLRDAALAELTASVERTRDEYRHAEILDHLPHVRAVVGVLPGSDDWSFDDGERHLLSETGRVQIEAGQTQNALADFEALYAACEHLATVEPITYYSVLCGLATAYGVEGRHSLALRLKLQAVDGLTAVLGGGHRDVLIALNNLAVSYLDSGRYPEAHGMFRTVYLGRRDHPAMGRTHRDTLIALNNLAIARGHLGEDASERAGHRRAAHLYWLGALARWRKIAAPDDQYAMDVLNGLALSYRAQGMRRQALHVATELYERRKALLGNEHPDTVSALENKLIITGDADDTDG